MYKKIKTWLMPICLSAVLLCGCSQTENAETTAVTEKTSHTTAVTTVQTALETTASVTLSQKDLTEEQKQIQDLLTEAKQFFFDYYRGYEIQTHADYDKFVTQEVTLSNGELFEEPLYEIVSGDVKTKDDLINKMKPIFTDELTDETLIALGGAHDYYYFDDDGKIYISGTVGGEGGQLGYDEAHISSVDEIDNDTLVLNMTAFGSAERWGYDSDKTENFTATLKWTEDGLRIDKCDYTARMFITYQYKPEYDVFA